MGKGDPGGQHQAGVTRADAREEIPQRPFSEGRPRALFAAVHESPLGRFCCKSLFALAIKISFGCTGDFHVNMWGTSSSEERLAGDPGNVIEATSIGGRRLDFFTVGKLAPGNFGLLQQYLP